MLELDCVFNRVKHSSSSGPDGPEQHSALIKSAFLLIQEATNHSPSFLLSSILKAALSAVKTFVLSQHGNSHLGIPQHHFDL